jgi:hypothetical protein
MDDLASCAAASALAICAPIRALSSDEAPARDPFTQRLAGIVRHRDEQSPVVVLADVVHRRDVRVIEPRPVRASATKRARVRASRDA